MLTKASRFWAFLAIMAVPATALATDPAIYPDNAKGATSFDWQKEWGSIHMNSFADGLNDPGVPATNTGDTPCDNKLGLPAPASLCQTISQPASGYSTISNGIKYDIKRSFLGCMAEAMPNWSINNVWDSDIDTYGPCALQPDLNPYRIELLNSSISDPNKKFAHDYTGPETKWNSTQKTDAAYLRTHDTSVYYDPANPNGRKFIVYQPIYDPRANDDRAWLTNQFVGCQQQISNNCSGDSKGNIIRDVHACVGSPASGLMQDGPGYHHPVSHVFSPQEIADLQATYKLLNPGVTLTALPVVYWTYQSKDAQGNKRTKLSAIDPQANSTLLTDMVADGQIEKIDTSDPTNTADHFLSNLKSYRFTVGDGDLNTFVVVDPSDFFDLRLYIDGGKYASGYNHFDSNHLVQTWNTCPVLGITSGYSGICDPTGNAGCNLPIYGQAAQTTFTDASGASYTYNNYPLKWSGYVKKWAVLTKDQYLQNICGNGGCSPNNLSESDREDYYIVASDEGLNDNPIIQITRANDYCEVAEMTSNPRHYVNAGQRLVADMPCVQYIQYQSWQDENGNNQYSFVDLYNPVEAAFDTIPPENDTMQLFNLDKNGNPDYGAPVKGTGSGRFVGSSGSGYVRLLDAEDPANPGHAFVDNAGNSAMISTYFNQKTDPNMTAPIAAVGHNMNQVQSTHVDAFGNPIMTTGQYQVWLDASKNVCVPANPNNANDPANAGCKPDITKGVALSVKPGTATAIRFPQEVTVTVPDPKNPNKMIQAQSSCVVVSYNPPAANFSQKVFVPTNSFNEFQQFVSAMQAGSSPVQGLSFSDCAANYQAKAETLAQLTKQGVVPNSITNTAVWLDGSTQKQYAFKTWTGAVQCKDLVSKPACNQARIISAQRRCQLENGAEGKCGDCANAADPDDPKASGFDFADSKVGAGGHVDILVSPMADSNKCYFSAACMGMDSETCPPANVPGGHVFCLSPDTKITMADGKEKPIKQVKAGEEVVSFNAKRTRDGELAKAKVKATAITKDQEIIQINNLKITPLHKIILANGRAVAAKEIKVGDAILKGNGQIEKVTKVKKNLKKITVYNLVLDKENDGYIAGGVRVMSYPLMKEMEIISGHAEVQAKAKKHRRYGAGGRSLSSVNQ